ncbi:hypothetical protein B0H12DRAFT_326177 [Mycena haematopus]|nr:hypothetical protein B0H12DRAFT_326177 [Mycena haematopus]
MLDLLRRADLRMLGWRGTPPHRLAYQTSTSEETSRSGSGATSLRARVTLDTTRTLSPAERYRRVTVHMCGASCDGRSAQLPLPAVEVGVPHSSSPKDRGGDFFACAEGIGRTEGEARALRWRWGIAIRAERRDMCQRTPRYAAVRSGSAHQTQRRLPMLKPARGSLPPTSIHRSCGTVGGSAPLFIRRASGKREGWSEVENGTRHFLVSSAFPFWSAADDRGMLLQSPRLGRNMFMGYKYTVAVSLSSL